MSRLIYRFCSTQLSTKFKLLIKTKMLVLAFKLSDVVFIMLINVRMPTIVGIITFMNLIIFMLSCVEHEKSFIALGPDFLACEQQRHRLRSLISIFVTFSFSGKLQ